MGTVIEQPRHFCTLGAQQTVVAIKGAIPILHAGPGCSSKLFGGISFAGGYHGAGYAGGNAIPCTNATEKEVVFGGEEKLRTLIENTLRVMNGELFVVLTGCTSDIVGDDIESIVGSFQDEGVPIIYAETGGFKGTNYKGHELVLDAIIEQFLDGRASHDKIKGLVNVFATVPYQDPFWNGNLEAVKSLLEGIGLKPNVLFGQEALGVKSWELVPQAEFNILISPYIGLGAVEKLKEKFDTPYFQYPVLPIGAKETGKFLREVSNFAKLDTRKTEDFISKNESRFYYYLENAADFLLEFKYDLPAKFSVVADSFYTPGVTRFLVNEIGLLPGHQFITDDIPEDYRELVLNSLEQLAIEASLTGKEAQELKAHKSVTFSGDGSVIQNKLREYKDNHVSAIIGGTWDKDIAYELNAHQLSISIPITDRLILDRTYIGYSGGLRFAEDLYGNVLKSYS